MKHTIRFCVNSGALGLVLAMTAAGLAYASPPGFHSADSNPANWAISLPELLRVIQFYNSGGYHVQSGTVDGYGPGAGSHDGPPHDSDYTPPDWKIGLPELLRLIQFYNSGGYHVQPGTADGYAPGRVTTPSVTSFTINGGAATTMPLAVTLNNTAAAGPTECLASESASFTGASWQPYATAPAFTLSFGVGTRTVYFKVRNALGESDVAADTIFVVPNMVSVAAGTFTMGRTASGDDAAHGASNERPQHPVTLGAYQLGRGEATNKEYCDVLNWARAQGYLYRDAAGTPWAGSGDLYAGGAPGARYLIVTFAPSDLQYSGGVFSSKTRVGLPGATNYSMDTHPMMYVSWYGAVAFCNWVSQWQGLTPCYDLAAPDWPLTAAPPTPAGYRLLTEAEWERAAAWDGSKHWIYGFTSDTLTGKDRANYYDSNPNYVNPLGLATSPSTSPVGWFDGVHVSPNGGVPTVNGPSPVGAYDMSGNLWEWCHDWYDAAYYSGGPMTNPAGPDTGSNRVLRGGACFDPSYVCRSAIRFLNTPATTKADYGFRIGRTP